MVKLCIILGVQQICINSLTEIIWLLMLHDKPCVQFCLFMCLLAIGHGLLSYAHRLFSQAGSEIKCVRIWGSTLYHIILKHEIHTMQMFIALFLFQLGIYL